MASRAPPIVASSSGTERAPWFVGILTGDDHRFDFVNDTFREIYGARSYEGHALAQLFPEVMDQAYPSILKRVLKTGSRVSLKNSVIQTRSPETGAMVQRTIDIHYAPTLDTSGAISGVYLEGFVTTPTALQVLAQRAAAGGLKSLSDAEVLALVVHQQSHDSAAQDVADQLLGRFGSLGGVLSASMADLSQIAPAMADHGLRELSRSTALHLKLVRELGRRVLRHKIGQRPVLSSSSLVRTFLSASLRYVPREEFHVLFLDHSLNLIADEVLGRGSISQVSVHSREVMRRALELSATALILVHNHPSGSRSISASDRAITIEIVRAGKALGIEVHDHLIVAGDEIVSFAAKGLLADHRRRGAVA